MTLNPSANNDNVRRPNAPILRTDGLSKTFGPLTAVKGLGIELHPGEVLGFLGPNGSGKSTTIGMILGLIRPSGGHVQLFGKSLGDCGPAEFGRVGAVLENSPLYPFLSGRDNLIVQAQTSHVERTRVEETLDIVGLTNRAHSKVHTYSLGMKQRLSLAGALLADPDFLVLDEPTNGMDPGGLVEVRKLIRELGQQGKAILLSSHLLHEVEQVCTRLIIIDHGEVLAQGPLSELLRRRHEFQVRVLHPKEALLVLEEQQWVVSARQDGEYVLVETAVDRAQDITAVLAKEGMFLSELRPREETLERFFQQVTERQRTGKDN